MDVAPGKSLLARLVPCQVIVQPPAWRETLSAVAGDEDVGAGAQRQQMAAILEQDQGFAHRLARHRAMRGRAEQLVAAGEGTLRRAHLLEQAGADLDAKDAAHRFVEARLRDLAGADLGQGVGIELAPAVGRHEHVEAGVEALRAGGVGAAVDLAVRVPVADDQAVEADLVADDAGEQVAAAMDLGAAHPREARHDRLDAGLDRRRIAGAVNVAQVGGRGRIVALVAAILGAAVADEMLGGGDDPARAEEFGRAGHSLQALDHRAGKGTHDLGMLGEAFIGAPPAVVADDGEGRREVPVDAGHRHLDRGHFADPADEVGIAGRAEADILREDGRADDIGMAVDRVDAPHHRNPQPVIRSAHRRVPIGVGQGQPVRRGRILAAAGCAVAAGEHRAEAVAAIFLGRDAGDVGLHDLGNLLLERHPREHLVDPRFDGRIAGNAALHRRPAAIVRGRSGRGSGGRRCLGDGAGADRKRRRQQGDANHGHFPPLIFLFSIPPGSMW